MIWKANSNFTRKTTQPLAMYVKTVPTTYRVDFHLPAATYNHTFRVGTHTLDLYAVHKSYKRSPFPKALKKTQPNT